MSEQTKEVVDVVALQAQINEMQEQLTSSNVSKDRVLEESKNWKSKAQAANARLEEIEKTKLVDDGKVAELNQVLMGEKNDLQSTIKGLQTDGVEKEIKYLVAASAGDANDVNDVINSLDASLLSIDSDTGVVTGVADAVKKVREDKAYLFAKATVPLTENGRPAVNVEQPKKLSDMTLSEKKVLLPDAIKSLLKRT